VHPGRAGFLWIGVILGDCTCDVLRRITWLAINPDYAQNPSMSDIAWLTIAAIRFQCYSGFLLRLVLLRIMVFFLIGEHFDHFPMSKRHTHDPIQQLSERQRNVVFPDTVRNLGNF